MSIQQTSFNSRFFSQAMSTWRPFPPERWQEPLKSQIELHAFWCYLNAPVDQLEPLNRLMSLLKKSARLQYTGYQYNIIEAIYILAATNSKWLALHGEQIEPFEMWLSEQGLSESKVLEMYDNAYHWASLRLSLLHYDLQPVSYA